MFILDVNYTADLAIIDQYLAAHREWLKLHYAKGLLLYSGPKNPRTGGIIIARGNDRKLVDELIKNDPYTLNKVAIYEVTEFNPALHHEQLKDYL